MERVSSIPGRIRWRSQTLKSEEMQSVFLELMQLDPNWIHVEMDVRTGSLLVRYDHESLSAQTVIGRVEELWQQACQRTNTSLNPVPKIQKRNSVGQRKPSKKMLLHYAMTGLFVGTAVSGMYFKKRIHVIYASLFGVSMLTHMSFNRRMLFK